MNKKILIFTLFIIIILLCNNSYAYTYEDVNYSFFINNINASNIGDYIQYCFTYFNNLIPKQYYIVYKNNYTCYFDTTLTPFYYSNGSLYLSSVNENEYKSISSGSSKSFFSFNISNNTNTSGGNQIIGNNNSYVNNISNFEILYSNIDIINTDDNSIYFTKNFDLQSSSEESEPIDMSEIIAPLEHIKALLFYICLYLLCKVIYGVIWWIYKKSIL